VDRVSGAVARGASRALAALLSDRTRFAMPIRLLLEHDHAFTPEDVKVLIDAFEDTLRALRLHDREDPLTMAVAKIIIELAKDGERDPTRLRDLALKAVSGTP
jgi:hypothetical protein